MGYSLYASHELGCFSLSSSLLLLLVSLELYLLFTLIIIVQDQKLPGPPAYIFMIDVSYQSVQCGMVRMLMKELKELLNFLPK